jgi:hypothetical protein
MHRPSQSSAAGSKVTVEFQVNRVLFSEYQKGALLETIAQAAEKLGMSGKVVAAAIRYAGPIDLKTHRVSNANCVFKYPAMKLIRATWGVLPGKLNCGNLLSPAAKRFMS